MKDPISSQAEDFRLEIRGQVWIPQDMSLLGSGDQNERAEAEKSTLQVMMSFNERCFSHCICNCLLKIFVLIKAVLQ